MLRALGKTILRCTAPNILVEHHRRQFRLRTFGIPHRLTRGFVQCKKVEEAVQESCYALWAQYVNTTVEDWVLVDVGANAGEFLRAALTLTRQARVIAFEPLPECYPSLREAVKGCANARIIEAAVGARPGRAVLRRIGPTMSSVLSLREEIACYYPAVQESGRMDVPVVTLDDALAETDDIGLLKIDVQGYELEVLRGAVSCLRRTQAVLLEINYVSHYDGAPEFGEINDFLSGTGFALRGVSAPFVVDQTPLWANALYAPKAATPRAATGGVQQEEQVSSELVAAG
jgi:FkbM family methyltransferase